MEIPSALGQFWRHERAWLAELPELVDACAKEWDLRLGEPFESATSLVVPAGEAVLKLTAPSDRETDEEADALETWSGHGAVKLLAQNRERRAFLIERCGPGTRLWSEESHQLEVAVELLSRLTIPIAADRAFRSVGDEAARWLDEVPRRFEEAGRPFERPLLDYARTVYESAKDDGYLVNQDLHGGNILSALREPWLVIDPKPLSGEPELSCVGLLRNAASASDFSPATVRRYLDAFATLGLDRERCRAWGVAHALAWGYDQQGWIDWSIEVARTIRAA
jgi:streptomycin 6-kinase